MHSDNKKEKKRKSQLERSVLMIMLNELMERKIKIVTVPTVLKFFTQGLS